MKKRIVAVVIVVICLAAVIFIGGRDKTEEKPDNKVSIGEIIETTKENQKEEKTTEKQTEKETEIGSFTPDEIEKKDPEKIVEFEIPVLFLDLKYQNDLNALVKDKGYESAEYTRNKKTVKIRLKALSYDLYLVKVGMETIKGICETFDSEDYPYVKNLGDYEDDFSHVTLLVSSKKFKKADNVDDLFSHVSNCCAYYLLQAEDSPNKYTIDICDVKTGKLLATREYNKKDFLR